MRHTNEMFIKYLVPAAVVIGLIVGIAMRMLNSNR
jgi:hypothetical protein